MKITILGAGPGGYEAALDAAKCGHEVTLIEKEYMGGTCLNCGCIPTKALLASSDMLHDVRNAAEFGVLNDGNITASFGVCADRKEKIVTGLRNGVGFLMDQNHVRIVNGYGRLSGGNTVTAERADGGIEVIESDKIILATGSSEAVPPIFPYDKEHVITSKEALSLEEIPESIAIVGGGVIGCELGQFFARFGSKVTIIEMMEHILPAEDKEAAKILERSLKKDGVKIFCGVPVKSMEINGGSVTVKFGDDSSVEVEKALIAIGRKPNTGDIGLDQAGIETDKRGFIIVDGMMRTSNQDIYAIGDIVPTPQLAHVAAKEGFTAVDAIGGRQTAEINYNAVPRCIYTDPEVAGVGITEDSAKQKNIAYRKGTFDFKALGKARASGKTEGMVKILADENDVIIGASIVGAHASDMLSVLTLAVTLGLKVNDVDRSIFPHPSMSEAIMEALHDVHKSSVHKL